MKRKEMQDLTVELIEEVMGENAGKEEKSSIVFTERAKEIIKAISEYAKTTNIWEREKEQREKFWSETKDATPEMVYGYMLDRIVNAPLPLFMDCSVVLIMPKLDELVNGDG